MKRFYNHRDPEHASEAIHAELRLRRDLIDRVKNPVLQADASRDLWSVVVGLAESEACLTKGRFFESVYNLSVEWCTSFLEVLNHEAGWKATPYRVEPEVTFMNVSPQTTSILWRIENIPHYNASTGAEVKGAYRLLKHWRKVEPGEVVTMKAPFGPDALQGHCATYSKPWAWLDGARGFQHEDINSGRSNRFREIGYRLTYESPETGEDVVVDSAKWQKGRLADLLQSARDFAATGNFPDAHEVIANLRATPSLSCELPTMVDGAMVDGVERESVTKAAAEVDRAEKRARRKAS